MNPRCEPAVIAPAAELRVSKMRQGVTGVKTKSLLNEPNCAEAMDVVVANIDKSKYFDICKNKRFTGCLLVLA